MRKFVLVFALLSGCGLSLIAAPVSAQVNVDWGVTITAGSPPPPVRYEPMPPPRAEFVWVAGYWRWRNGAYSWMPGRWERARAGYDYAQPAWREGPGGWQFQQGGWRRAHGHDEKKQKNKGHEHVSHQDSDRGSDHCPPGHRRKGNC